MSTDYSRFRVDELDTALSPSGDGSREPPETTMTMAGESNSADPTVLIVEDDKDLAKTYSLWLEPEYDVRTSHSGSDALTWYDSEVSVVILDRRMQDLPGATVIQQMDERDTGDQKVMLTRSEPGCDAGDIPCDEYLTKPVTESELQDTVDELQLRSQLDSELQRYFRLISKIVAIENSSATGTEAALRDLRNEANQVREQVQDSIDDLAGVESAFRAID
ncbi:response regulator transcription factor [Halorubrum laminariae]|uniref:Response regulator transcription factor n=1 Tax=Halorubrum laminariae TaxID=1433523 RepID=A0ABD6BVR1_9EURY|nr:response regulator [Halorubrum laminariae]